MWFLIFTSIVTAKVGAETGLLIGDVNNPSTQVTACVLYNPVFHPIPKTLKEAKKEKLVDFSTDDGCGNTTIYENDVTGKMVVVRRGNCSYSEKALLAQEHGGISLLVVNPLDRQMQSPGPNNSIEGINISVAIVAESDFKQFQDLDVDKIEVRLFGPDPPKIDYNMILIWLIAMLCVAVGSHWAGNVTFSLYLRKRPHLMRPGEEKIVDAHPKSEDEGNVNLGVKHLLILVVVMCGVIVALYFLYDYLVYLIIAVFCIAGSTSLYNCIWPWIETVSPLTRIPPNPLPLLSSRPQVKSVILLAACFAFGITWAVERNASFAWILQDIMGLTFCIFMQKTIRLPSLKTCTILLVLLFFYDIFFVFVTKLFTKSGESVMVEVATGGGSSSGEQLPMVFKVPRLSTSLSVKCYRPYSLLGFGDIIVPGLLISFCSGFGRKVRSPHVYFVCATIAYGVGLLITFIALAFMKTGQPALLYLVPCTLISTVLLAIKRRELKMMWKGEPNQEKANGAPHTVVSDQSYQTPPPVPELDAQDEEEGPAVVRETDERQLLINRQPTG